MSIRKFTSKKKYNHHKNNNFRNEKKILFFESENFLKNFLKVNSFKQIYNERYINSIYFDDHNLTNLLETIDGEKYRSKIRLRWYGKIKDITQNPTLEEKIKINAKNFKIYHPLKLKKIKDRVEVRKIKLEILKQLDSESLINFKIRNVEPSSFVSYKRSYYKKEGLRITLDKELIYRNLINQKYIHENENFKKERFVILEFKFNDKNYNLVRNLSSQIPNRFTKFSKYEYSLLN